jgi:hypothetical protein
MIHVLAAGTVGVSTSGLTVPILVAFCLGMILGIFLRGKF